MKYFATSGNEQFEINLVERGRNAEVMIGDNRYRVDLQSIDRNETYSLLVNNESYEVTIERTNGGFTVTVEGETFPVTVLDEREAMSEQVLGAVGEGDEEHRIRSVIPGIVVSVLVEEGQAVEAGEPVMTVEAMKMENEIKTPIPGVIEAIYVKEGQTIGANVELVLIAPPEGPLL